MDGYSFLADYGLRGEAREERHICMNCCRIWLSHQSEGKRVVDLMI
jgi:hypothetical protein